MHSSVGVCHPLRSCSSWYSAGPRAGPRSAEMAEPLLSSTTPGLNGGGSDDSIENGDLVADKKPAEGRQTWARKTDFLMSCISLAVGLGNIWRFCYLVQKNGGGTFLIPYIIMLILEGLPLFFLELSIGQRMQKGVIGTWTSINPALAGIGWAACVTSFLVSIYYNVIIAWALFYLFNSFQSSVPWGRCPGSAYFSQESLTACENNTSKYFWYNEALDASSSIADAGDVNWKLALCLLLAWLVVFITMCKGIKATGKVVYFTTLYPYVVLTILFFRGITLSGAGDGVDYLFKPDWSKLYDPEVWLEAATQIFFSLSLGFGGLVAYASYNSQSNNTLRDAILVTLVNCFTSVYAAIVVFAILGHQAKRTGLKLSDVGEGPGLAFIAFGEGLALLTPSVLWAILFFLMLLTLGLGSMFGTLESVLTSMADIWPFKKMRREWHVALVCAVSYLIGLAMVTQAGEYVVELFDQFAATLPLLLVAFFECFVVVYVYGLNRFCCDIEQMTGKKPSVYWRFCWRFLSPLIMLILFFGSIIYQSINSPEYSAYVNYKEVKKSYPGWALALAAIIVLSSVSMVPLIAFVKRPPQWRRQLRHFATSFWRMQSWSPPDVPLEESVADDDHPYHPIKTALQ